MVELDIDKVKEIARRYSLMNAHEFGKAEVNTVIGKVIFEMPEVKSRIKEIAPEIKRIVEEVNKMTAEEISAEIASYAEVEKAKEKEEEKEEEEVRREKKLLPPSLLVSEKIVLRFAPEPSGYMHIGHAKAAFLSYQIAKENDGEFHLRFDDTNPENAKQEYIDEFKRDLNWLGIGWNVELYASDFMDLIYSYGREIIKMGKAYVCECTPEIIKLNRRERRGCSCREKPLIQNIRDYERMLNGGFEEGEAVVRFLGDPRSLNSVMRDPTLFRISKKKHYRQGDKYLLWPSYDFECPIVDSIKGITHVIRSKEYELRDELYNSILDVLGLRKPMIISISRLEIDGNSTSKRFIRELIQKKQIQSWSDPRLLTIAALRRRGIIPEAIRKFVLSFGIGKAESKGTIEQLLVENRKILDPISKRYNFVRDPIKLTIPGLDREVEIPFHPDREMGKRKIHIKEGVYIDRTDVVKEGEIIRLKDLCNILIEEVDDFVIFAKEVEVEKMPERKIQWVSSDAALGAIVLRPSNLLNEKGEFNPKSLIIENGVCEESCAEIPDGEIVQFVRYGFVKKEGKDEEGKKLKFIYSC